MGYRSLMATAWATGSCFGIAQEHHHAIILLLEKTCVRRRLHLFALRPRLGCAVSGLRSAQMRKGSVGF